MDFDGTLGYPGEGPTVAEDKMMAMRERVRAKQAAKEAENQKTVQPQWLERDGRGDRSEPTGTTPTRHIQAPEDLEVRAAEPSLEDERPLGVIGIADGDGARRVDDDFDFNQQADIQADEEDLRCEGFDLEGPPSAEFLDGLLDDEGAYKDEAEGDGEPCEVNMPDLGFTMEEWKSQGVLTMATVNVTAAGGLRKVLKRWASKPWQPHLLFVQEHRLTDQSAIDEWTELLKGAMCH